MNHATQSTSGPYLSTRTLKENQFKKVELIVDVHGKDYIRKTYRGRNNEYCQLNAQYAFEVLNYFYQHFSDITIIPQPIALNDTSITLEYLPALPSAKLFTGRSLSYTHSFFERCYESQEPSSFFRNIKQSVYFNSAMKSWLDSRKPLALGLKGDLWQNLCKWENQLILADIDSAAVEPLGFSEIVMHAEIHAEFSIQNLQNQLILRPYRPVCFDLLTREESQELLEMGLQFVSMRMDHLPRLIRGLKVRLARNALESTLDQ